ncbi:MAG: pyruvate formate lyase family protein [Candidatus Latescibacterota bacterium]
MTAVALSPQEVAGSAARIALLRRRVLQRKDAGQSGWSVRPLPVTTARALRASEGEPSWQRRRGRLLRARLAAVRFAIDDLELLAGRIDTQASEGTEAEVAEARAYLERYPGPPGQNGHCELDLGPLLETGMDGLAERLRGLRAGASGVAAEAYDSFLDALAGLALLVEHAAAAAGAAMAGASPARRAELEGIADECRHVAHHPPRTFREALQLAWLTLVGVMQGEPVGLVVPGHLDRTLYPFFAADLAAGRLTEEGALVLLESLYLLINDFIPDGLAIGVMVGGRDASGADVTNPLSYLCLEALRRTALIYPTVGVCWHAGTPATLVDLAVALIASGNANPAFFGDGVIQRGLQRLGVPPGESCRYVNSTCVEITPGGASNVWVASPYYNTCQVLREQIAASVAQPPADFRAFREAYLLRLAAAVEAGVAEQNRARHGRREGGRKPLQSLFTRCSLERGRDIDDGGAAYNWVECSFVGLANLADSLHVVDQEVYRRRRLSFAGLHDLLERDFRGQEDVRLRFLNGYPKYGQGCAEVDALVAEVVGFVDQLCRRFRMAPDDSHYVPGAFVWVMHERLGGETGATPDGRRAGFPFADGCGPAQGRERLGPTAAILSTTSWDHAPMIGGLAYNMKFSASLFRTPEGCDRLRDLILTYLQRGGFETQVNVVDHQTLKEARQHPERYRDLVVRIGGYTDYFTRLPPGMQDEVMLRTEYGHA